jgi:hypothetical protein
MKRPESTVKSANQLLWETFSMEETVKQEAATAKLVRKFCLMLVSAFVLLFSACSQQPTPQASEDLEPQFIPMTWKQLGSALDVTPASNSRQPSLAVNSNGELFAAWTEDPCGFNCYKVMVKRWDGNQWSSMGGPLNVDNINKVAYTMTDRAIAVSGTTPVVAFNECNSIAFPANCNVYVKRWNIATSTWILLGGKLNFNSGHYPSIALNSSNQPVVAWFERNINGYNIYVKRWNGAAWVSLGPVAGANPAVNPSSATIASMPSLAVQKATRTTPEKIAVAWQECAIPGIVSGNFSPFTCQHKIFAKYYDVPTNTWKAWLGASGALNVSSSRDANSPSLELTSTGTPVIAFTECKVNGDCPNFSDQDVYVKRYGTKKIGSFFVFGFHPLGAPLDVNPLQLTGLPSLAIGLNNVPVVAWTESGSTGSGNAGIRVKRWNEGSASWQFYSGVSGSPLNISQTENAFEPSLVISSAGTPSVAFSEGQEGGNGIATNIYVRQLQAIP